MTYKTLIAASLLSVGFATAALAGEGNSEPFPLSVSIDANGPVVFSTAPDATGLPVGALNGTPFDQQAQSLARWYAQRADHRFAQQQLSPKHRG